MRFLIISLLMVCTACQRGAQLRVEHLVNPDYPLNAHSMNIQGTVVVHIQIGPDGKVLTASGTGPHPYLVKAAEDNVRQWVFGPFPPQGDYPIYHVVTYVYKLEGEPASVVFYPPVVRTALPDRVEIQTRPFHDDLMFPAAEAPVGKEKGTK